METARADAAAAAAHLRYKRDAKGDLEQRETECNNLKRGSIEDEGRAAITSSTASAAESAAAAASDLGDAAGTVPLLGGFAKAGAKIGSAAVHTGAAALHATTAGLSGEKMRKDLAQHDKGCDDVPFEKLTGHVDERFDKTDQSLEKNFSAIENNSKSLDRNLNAINDVGTKVDRNFRGIENNLKAINRNYDAIEKNYGAIKENFGAIKENRQAIQHNYEAIKQVSAQVDRNLGAIEKNFDQLKINEGEIKLVGGKVDRNFGAIKQVSGQVAQNLEAIERNFAQLKINEGEIRLVGGKVDRNFGAIAHVSAQVAQNLDAIRENLKVMTGNYHAIRDNYAAIERVSQKADRNFDTLVDNYQVTKQNLEAANRNYLAIIQLDDKIDRNYSVMLSGFKYILDKIDATKNEMNKRFDKLEQLLETTRKEEAVSQIIAFFEVFSYELNGLKDLAHDRLIEKLEAKDGTLSILKSVRNPSKGNLYNDLKTIIRQGLAIPKSSDDKMAFVVLDLLHSGTELYVSVLYSLVRSYVYMAANCYQKNDVDKYNQYLSELEITTKAFVDSLNGAGGNVGLLNELNAISDRVEELDFIKENREDLVEFLSERKNYLKLIRSNLEELIQRLPESAPVFKIGFDFSGSNITTGIGRWKNGDEVNYAIHSEKSDGGRYTKIGDWVSYQIEDFAMPLLSIGRVPDGERRSIFRRFNSDKPELVGTIEDGNQSEFRDIGQDLYNAVLKRNERLALNEIELLIKDGVDLNIEYWNKGYIMNVAASQGNPNILLALMKNGADIGARDSTGNTPIHIATQHGYKKLVEILIESGAEVNTGNYSNSTPLHNAANKGDTDIFTLLIDKGARVNSTTLNGYTPLHTAAAAGENNIVDLLALRPEVDIESATSQGFTALHLASAAGHDLVVNSLLRNQKIKVNSRDKSESTPLHLASMSGNLRVVKLLLAAQNETIRVNDQSTEGLSPLHLAVYFQRDRVVDELLKVTDIDVNLRTKDGRTPLHIAAKRNQPRVVSALLSKKAIPEERDFNDHTPLHLAAEQGNLAVVEILVNLAKVSLNVRRKDGRTPLQLAILKNKLNVVLFLINNGAKINTKDNNGISSLVYAIQTSKPDVVKALVEAYRKKNHNLNEALHSAAYNGNLDIVRILMQELKFKDLNPRDNDGITPIQFAALQGHLDIVGYLADRGADLHSKDNFANTAMHYAALGGNEELIEYLVEKGVHLNATNNYNVTPLHLASFGGHTHSVKYLLQAENGANVNSQDSKGNTAMHYLATSRPKKGSYTGIVKHMDEKGAKITLTNDEGYTPLMEFARSNKWSAVRFLIAKNTSPDIVNARDKNGWSLVFWAARYGKFDEVKMLIDDKKANYNIPNKNGLSILHVAILSGNLDLIKYLVGEKMVSTNISDDQSNSPLDLAAQLGYLDIVECLIKNRASKNALDKNKSTPLLRAASERKWDVVKFLIKNGANKKIADKDNNTLIHKLAEGGNLEIMKSLLEDYDLKNPTKNNRDETPLHLAVMNDRSDIIEYLVGEGKSVHSLQVRDKQGNTPLHYASLIGKLGIVKYLTERGSDPSVTNAADKNPCDLSADLNIAKYFIDDKGVGYNSNAFSVVENGSLGILKYMVEEQQLNPDMVDSGGQSLLHHAAKRGKINIVKYLVNSQRVDIHRRDQASRSPLYHALLNGHFKIVDYLDEMDNQEIPDYSINSILAAARGGDLKVIEYLIGNIADIDSKDGSGKTPLDHALDARDPESENTLLHYAVSLGSLPLVKQLVEMGANTSVRNKNGKTPVEIATNEQQEIIKYLIEREGEGVDSVFTATKQGNLAVLKNFIEIKKADINGKDKDNKTILDHAIDYGHMKIIKYLIDERGVVYDGDIFSAAVKGHLGMVRYFVEVKNQNPNSQDALGWTPLHKASYFNHIDLVKYLVGEKNANLNAQNKHNFTPLHAAAEKGCLDIVKYLVEKGADASAKDGSNKTPLDFAIDSNHLEIIKFLKDMRGATYDGDLNAAAKRGQLAMVKYFMEKNNLTRESKDAWIALGWAATNGHLNIVKYFIEEKGLSTESLTNGETKPDQGMTALHLAVSWHHLAIVKYLLEQGANINAKVDNKSLLDFANVGRGDVPIIKYLMDERGVVYGGDIFSAAEKGQMGMVRYFVEVKNQNPNSQDALGWTPLHRASYVNHLELVKYLVEEKNANVNAQNKYKFTPLHAAAEKGRLDIVKYLVEKGADARARDGSDKAPLDFALDNNHMEIINYLVNDRGVTYEGGIFKAVEKGQLGMVKYFVEVRKQNLESTRNESGASVLHIAVFKNRLDIVKYLVEEKKINVNAADNDGKTALHEAAGSLNLDLVKYLVEKGARIDIRAKDGKTTPLLSALVSKRGKSPVTEYLCTFYSSCILHCHTSTFSSNCMASTFSNNRPVRSIDYHSNSHVGTEIYNDYFTTADSKVSPGSRGKHVNESNSYQNIRVNTEKILTKRGFAYPQLGRDRSIERRKELFDDNESSKSENARLEAGNRLDVNGTLLAFMLLNKLPIVGKFFPKMKLASNSEVEPMPLIGTLDHARKVTEKFEKLLNESATQLNVSTSDLNLDSFSLFSEIARHLRHNDTTSGLSKLLYSFAEKAFMKNDQLLDIIRMKLPDLEETYNITEYGQLPPPPQISITNLPTINGTQNELRYLPSSPYSRNITSMEIENNSIAR